MLSTKCLAPRLYLLLTSPVKSAPTLRVARIRTSAQVESTAFAGLSDQETQILARIAQGQTNRGIGETLYLSEKTVRNYVSDILGKLGLTSRVRAAAYAARHHIERYAP